MVYKGSIQGQRERWERKTMLEKDRTLEREHGIQKRGMRYYIKMGGGCLVSGPASTITSYCSIGKAQSVFHTPDWNPNGIPCIKLLPVEHGQSTTGQVLLHEWCPIGLSLSFPVCWLSQRIL